MSADHESLTMQQLKDLKEVARLLGATSMNVDANDDVAIVNSDVEKVETETLSIIHRVTALETDPGYFGGGVDVTCRAIIASGTNGIYAKHKMRIGEVDSNSFDDFDHQYLAFRGKNVNFFGDDSTTYFYKNGALRMQIESYSNGCTSIGWYTFSDDRLKINEELIQNATNTLLKLRPQIYDKKDSLDSSETRKQAGLIVQEIYYEVPELRYLLNIPKDATLIDDNKYSNLDDIRNDPDYSNWGEKPASLNYTGLIPFLIQGFKEQNATIEAQKATIAAQASGLASLLARVEALEGN